MLIQLLGSLLAVWMRKQRVLQHSVMKSHAFVCHIRREIQPNRNDRKLIFRNLTLWAPPLHAVLDMLIQKQVDAVNTVINTRHLKYNCCVVCTIAAVCLTFRLLSRSFEKENSALFETRNHCSFTSSSSLRLRLGWGPQLHPYKGNKVNKNKLVWYGMNQCALGCHVAVL